jgi:peptidoglycan/xylan/chitin deacetylase (PgdA/CDA1 family)
MLLVKSTTVQTHRRLTLPLAATLAALLVGTSLSLHGLSSATLAPAPTGVAVAGGVAMHGAPEPRLADAPDVPLPAPEEATPASAPPMSVTSTTVGSVVVPILTYHYVLDVPANTRDVLLFNLSTSPRLFAQQMALLHLEGATPITLATLVDAMAGRHRLPAHPVVLTFDDGYVSFATAAAPVLLKYRFAATDYVVSGFVGHSGYMSASQVAQMDFDGLVIGSHTVHHVDLARTPAVAARAEIGSGKAALEALLGHPVLDFAYPYGGYNAAVAQMVQDAGFREAVTTVAGDVQHLGAPFELHRTAVGGALSLAAFAADAGLAAPSSAVYAEIARETTAPVQHFAQATHPSGSQAE